MAASTPKELIFSKSFTLVPGEDVSFTVPELQGATLRFFTGEVPGQDDGPGISSALNGAVGLNFIVPAAPKGGFEWVDIATSLKVPEGSLNCRVCVQSFVDNWFGEVLQIQVDFHLIQRPD